jgi:hypothetical protein
MLFINQNLFRNKIRIKTSEMYFFAVISYSLKYIYLRVYEY